MENKTNMKVAKKHVNKLEVVYGERGDIWAETKPGYYFTSTGCHTAHEYSQKDMYKEFNTIEECDCKECGERIA